MRLQAVFEELTHHFMLQIVGYHVFHWLQVLNCALKMLSRAAAQQGGNDSQPERTASPCTPARRVLYVPEVQEYDMWQLMLTG